ncbi:MAG: Mut7-C ubiquitin/RNAse domain-containing protein [Bacteroidales bacterium]|nr:Mut7-C ubiquitin/RNAse domain-containing protein [Bacteroidales bacterium]
MQKRVTIRFYEELNDLLPKRNRKKPFDFLFTGKVSIKDIVESMGVPHTEIDLILANGNSVSFSYLPQDKDMVSVYPVFEGFDISNVTRLRSKPLRITRFILDVHLGKLARLLRMLGFDTLYENDYEDGEIIEIAIVQKRIILTRNLGILKHKTVTHGYFVRSQQPGKQLDEIIQRFDLAGNIKPLSRCIECNGKIQIVEKKDIQHLLLPKTQKFYQKFFQCSSCKKVYWEGSHFNKMMGRIDKILSC